MKVSGPVTNSVETEDGSRWKRHADQLKNWLPSVSSEVAQDSLSVEADVAHEDSLSSPSETDASDEPVVEACPAESGLGLTHIRPLFLNLTTLNEFVILLNITLPLKYTN